MGKYVDRRGKRYGRLVAIKPVEKALTTKPGAKTGPKPKTTDERLRKVVGI